MTHTRLLSICRIQSISDLAQPFCYFHMLFLVYGSQILFHYLEPGPLSRGQTVVFNVSAWAMIWCYYQTCHVDPGKKGWVEGIRIDGEKDSNENRDKKVVGEGEGIEDMEWKNVRWCRKCDAVKPPRAHHCKKCKRFVCLYFLYIPFLNQIRSN